MFRMIAKLLKVLNSETDPSQISLAFSFSMIAGLTPFMSPHNLLVLFIVLLLRINLSACILGWAFFSGIAYLLDPLFHIIGLRVLGAAALEGLWTTLYNATLWRLEGFNNTIVMGSLVLSLAFFVPLYLLLNMFIRKYRDHVLTWIQKTRIMQVIKANKIYTLYRAASGLGGAS